MRIDDLRFTIWDRTLNDTRTLHNLTWIVPRSFRCAASIVNRQSSIVNPHDQLLALRQTSSARESHALLGDGVRLLLGRRPRGGPADHGADARDAPQAGTS